MIVQTILFGGHVRVGLGDNLHLRRGVPAPSNAALVKRAVLIIEQLDRKVGRPGEARSILRLPRQDNVTAKQLAGT